jgi:hypothetical protein
MLEAPTIYCEVVEEFWESAVISQETDEIAFTLKGKSYTLNSQIVSEALKLPISENAPIKDSDLVEMLLMVNYAGSTSILGKIARKNLRKEWSYFFDCVIKVFSGKITNYDAITYTMLPVAYGIL